MAAPNPPSVEQMKAEMSQRGGQQPKSTVKAYKLFRVHPDHPGKLFPLFVDANTPVKMNKWVDAKSGEMRGNKVRSKIGDLAYRPGWHAGDLPIATHIGEKSDPSLTAPDTRPENHAWAEVEMPNDVDWQSEATKRGTNAQGKVVPVKAHITDQIPKGGHYRYKTNPNMTGNWLIGGSMKVNRVLSDDEVSDINSKAGLADLPRSKPFNAKKFGFAGGGNVSSALVAPDEWKAEEHVNHMADGGTPKTPSVAQMKLSLNRQGMYSPLEKAAMAVPRTKGTAAEFMAEASKQPGYRKDEVEDRRVSMPAEKMSKEGFLAHLKTHPSPQLIEKVLRENGNTKLLDDLAKDITGEDYMSYEDLYGNQQQDVLAMAAKHPDYVPDPKYVDYQLPGGKNYREILLKLPQRGLNEKERNTKMFLEANKRRGGIPPQQEAMLQKLTEKAKNQDYSSSHWNDEPNVLAHMRVSDRTGPKGEKVLHVEEIQSDWHQEGRKSGYQKPATKQISGKVVNNSSQFGSSPDYMVEWDDGSISGGYGSAEEAQKRLNDGKSDAVTSGMPDAPFKKNWHELALKHALGMAAKGGYHGIAITPGQEQADRFDLSKQISSIAYDPQEKLLDAWDHNRRKVMRREINDESQLESYIGKEAANKLLQSQPVMGKHLLEGQDLKMGGEGMKGFYDKILPTYLNKLGKPHGAQVGAIDSSSVGADPDKPVDLHYFPITNSLRQQIKTEGLPQYQRGGIIHKAEGGNVATLDQMKAQLMAKKPFGLSQLQSVGVNEAPNLPVKAYMPPGGREEGSMMPIGGVDMNMQPGHQLMPQAAMPTQPQGMPGAPGQPQMGGAPMPGQPPMPGGPAPGGSNILQMTPQGQAMAAMGGGQPPQMPPRPMAEGGSMSDKSPEQMKVEMAGKDASQEKRVTVDAPGAGGVKGIVVPKHLIEGNPKAGAEGLKNMMDARAQVYGAEHREPLNLGQVGKIHKKTLEEHFAKPVDEQKSAEQEALNKIRSAKFIKHNKDTLDESEKLDTVEHEHDEQGRSHVGYASKGIAGHALFPKGHGKDMDYKVINTCPGQTEGCGGGKSAEGIVDTKQGTCFAPNAESQYAAAVSRRAGHAIAKHDPAMTKDWIIAHTGSMRNAASRADKQNKRMLYRPNVVDETDVSSRHVIRHLNEQRKEDGKPPIIANSYGKTNELHDPENGYHVTHSNVGPKVKKGQSISENISRDKARVRNTVMAADNQGDFKNEQGNKTPPKGSYMVTDVKRGSPMAKNMEGAITHAKYWSTGRTQNELSDDEKAEGDEGHYSASGRKTSEENAHYGHRTHQGLRYEYQRQHILHPRLVQVGKNDDGTPHMIPTDSRFKDTEFLPKNRYKTKNGKEAGHILMTTPTESTSNIGHQTSFTHHVGPEHIEHAKKNNGEYEIDKPEDQAKAAGKEYAAPQAIQFKPKPKKYAMGGSVGGRHAGFSDDDFHAFPEQNVVAQRHNAMRHGDDELEEKARSSKLKRKINVHKDMDTMAYELSRKTKAK